VRTLAGHTSWVLLVLALSLFPHFCSFCLHSFIRSPFTQPAAAVTDSQPTTSHWFQPSRGALHVSVHQFTAMAWMRSQIRDGLHSSRSSSSNEDEASSVLLQSFFSFVANTQRVWDRYLLLVLFLVFLFCGFNWRVWTLKTTSIRWVLRENNEMLILKSKSSFSFWVVWTFDLWCKFFLFDLILMRIFGSSSSSVLLLQTGYSGRVRVTRLAIGSCSRLEIQPD
jgi:hypothetical protein